MQQNYTPILLLGLILSGAGQAQEQVKEILSDAISKTEVKFNGWDQYLGIGLNGTFIDNANVVGKDNGQTTSLGLKFEGELNHKDGASLWTNSFSALTAFSRTPLLGEYVKSEDYINAESLLKHLYSDVKQFGSFVRVQGETAMFDGYDTRAETQTFQITRLDAALETVASDRLQLTQSFKPLKFSESVGMFSNLFSDEVLTLDIKAGLGLRQVFAKGQKVVSDDKKTTEIEVKELDDYSKAGYEFGSELSGKSPDKKVSYKLSANLLLPFYESNTAKSSASTFDKRVIDINGKVSFYLVEWASLDYLAKVQRDPNLLAKAQVSHSFLFSTKYVFADRRKS